MRSAMALMLGLVLGSLVFGRGAAAQTPPAFPSGAPARETVLLANLDPDTRAWVGQEAAREASSPIVSETAVVAAVMNTPALGNLAGGDIEALAFIVMMEASKSSEQDLNAIMQGVKSINNAKAALRQTSSKLNAAAMGAANSVQVRTVPPNAVKRVVLQSPPKPRPDLNAAIDRAKNNLDALNELGETESLRLQMAMDRRSKMMTTLSNIMKKMSDTDSGIVQNLK